MKKTLILIITAGLFLLSPLFGAGGGSSGTMVTYYATAAATGATTVETAVTLTRSVGSSATSTGTSFVIGASGRIFRIVSITFATRGHSTGTAQTTTFNVRVNTAGAVTTSSTPIVFSARSATAAVASDWDRFSVPANLELTGDGTAQFGVTVNSTYTTNAPTVDVVIQGYEFQP